VKTIDLHIIDIANNSIRAKASEILIEVKDSEKDNSITLVITDTGCGISPEKLKEINESFYSSRAKFHQLLHLFYSRKQAFQYLISL